MSGYGSTPVEASVDRSLVVTWAGPEAEAVLFTGSDPAERAAIHEAGHLVVGWRFGKAISGACITPSGAGVALFGPVGARTADVSKANVVVAPRSRRELSDSRLAVATARLLRSDRRSAHALLRTRRFEARLLVNRYADQIRAVAAALLQHGRLTGVEVEAVILAQLSTARSR